MSWKWICTPLLSLGRISKKILLTSELILEICVESINNMSFASSSSKMLKSISCKRFGKMRVKGESISLCFRRECKRAGYGSMWVICRGFVTAPPPVRCEEKIPNIVHKCRAKARADFYNPLWL